MEKITDELDGDIHVFSLLIDGKKVCGARVESYSLLLDITTTKGEERKGYGEKLLLHIEQIARKHAENMKTDDIDPCNYEAVSFFKSMGYKFNLIEGDERKFIEATKNFRVWIANNSNVEKSDFEDSRRCLLTAYHSYVQNHAGYLIAIFVALIALLATSASFPSSLAFWVPVGVLISSGLIFYDILRMAYWTAYTNQAITLSQNFAIHLFNKVNPKFKNPYPEEFPAPEMAVLQFAIDVNLENSLENSTSLGKIRWWFILKFHI